MTILEDLNWIKTHLILLAIVVGGVYGGIYLIESKMAEHDKVTAAIYQSQNQQFQAQVKEEIDALKQANVLLAQSVATRQVVEVKLPTQNGSLTATQAAQEITKSVKANPGEVTSVGDTVVLDLPVARVLTTMAELVPLLQADKADLTQQLTNETKIYNDEVSAHKKDTETDAVVLKACKADSRRGKFKWFGIGYVAGFLTRTILVP